MAVRKTAAGLRLKRWFKEDWRTPKTSAYRSGAMAKCRKVGAANWGEGGKKKK